LFESEIIDKSEEDVPEDKQIGLIGEEVLKAFPELVTKDQDGNIAIDYTGFSAVFIEAFKEQQKMIEELKERITVLEEKNE
jgi:methylthioribose-1-phosphate isomerase